jgi:D-serine deaminase-like pyridoxal phosphate-dependent protein
LDLYTCLGGGYVASGSAGTEKLPRPYLPDGAALLPLEGAGEVQTPVRYRGPERLALGDPIFMRHSKAGELCEHFNTLLLVMAGRVVGEVPTYRGEGQVFL